MKKLAILVAFAGALLGAPTTPINNANIQLNGVSQTGVLAGNTTGAATATQAQVSTALDLLGATRGSVLYRGASGWTELTPGTAGYFLRSAGAGADPAWAAEAGTGTVTSVDASGGTTGLTFTGGPITTSGTLTLGGTLGVPNGGTGATSLTSTALLLGGGTSPISASDLTYSTSTLSTPDGFTLSSAGSIALTAGGSNQNITLTPSGTGLTLIGPKVTVDSVGNIYNAATTTAGFTAAVTTGQPYFTLYDGDGGADLKRWSIRGSSSSSTTTSFLQIQSRTDADGFTANLWTIDRVGNTTQGGNLTLGGAATITGGAGNMTITAGTGNSRTLALQTTTSGGTATTALTLSATQTATFASTIIVGTDTATTPSGSVFRARNDTNGPAIVLESQATGKFPALIMYGESGGERGRVFVDSTTATSKLIFRNNGSTTTDTYLDASTFTFGPAVKPTVTNTTEATTGGAGSLVSSGGIYAAKKIISGTAVFDGSANTTITGGAGNMTITAGTGASRTLTLQTTNSGSSAATFLSGDANQNTTISKLITSYNGISTAGNGVVSVQGAGRSTAQTAANASVATYTVGAADASFVVSANVRVTTSSAEAFTVTCAYTDEGNTARTITFNFQLVGGTIGTAIAFANGAVPYQGLPLHIRAKAATAITIATTGTFTGCTYNVEGVITKLQ